MSKENVESVRAAIDALNRGDMDAAFEGAAPDFEMDNSRSLGPFRGVFHGLDEARRWTEEFANLWESRSYEVEEFIDAGDHVVASFTDHLRGRDGIEVQARGTFVWTFHEGTCVRLTLYQERQEALEAAGLSE